MPQVPEEFTTRGIGTAYRVTVFTSDIRYAGTDANVHLTLYGEKDDTGRVPLAKSETNRNMWCVERIVERRLEGDEE